MEGVAVFFLVGLADFMGILLMVYITKDRLFAAMFCNAINAIAVHIEYYIEIGNRDYVWASLAGILIFGSAGLWFSMRRQKWFDDELRKLEKKTRTWIATAIVRRPVGRKPRATQKRNTGASKQTRSGDSKAGSEAEPPQP